MGKVGNHHPIRLTSVYRACTCWTVSAYKTVINNFYGCLAGLNFYNFIIMLSQSYFHTHAKSIPSICKMSIIKDGLSEVIDRDECCLWQKSYSWVALCWRYNARCRISWTKMLSRLSPVKWWRLKACILCWLHQQVSRQWDNLYWSICRVSRTHYMCSAVPLADSCLWYFSNLKKLKFKKTFIVVSCGV